jgi:hypothetical protein
MFQIQIETELMMAIIVACTAFAALTGVVIGQLVDSNNRTKRKERKELLIISCGLGVLATALAIAWFIFSKNLFVGCLAILSFLIQLLLFWWTSSIFWSEE